MAVFNIDLIMDMLDWNQPKEIQNQGRRMARELKCINVFLQPCHKGCNKNVWDNCALILSERKDEELEPYLCKLLSWLQDLNWPGAEIIMERMEKYKKTKMFVWALRECMEDARKLDDENWRNNLLELIWKRNHRLE